MRLLFVVMWRRNVSFGIARSLAVFAARDDKQESRTVVSFPDSLDPIVAN